MGEIIQFAEGTLQPTKGSCGLRTQLHGCMASVSALASVTNGISNGNFIEAETKYLKY